MKYFIIAGERSGDLHGSQLVKSLLTIRPEAQIKGFGGDLMKKAGVEVIAHYSETAYMGFTDVLLNLSLIRKKLRRCKLEVKEFDPDVLILIDYPSFNLRIAGYAKKLGIPTAYYISPKVWAWNTGRIKTIKSVVDKMLIVFPFEKSFYKNHNFQVEYVGNPLVEQLALRVPTRISNSNPVNVAFMPGSRVHEVKRSVKFILELGKTHPGIHFWITAVNNIPENSYGSLIGQNNISVVFERAYDVLHTCDVAIVTSGTATLEACLLAVPQMVCYRTSALTYRIAKTLIKVPFISLVNLIASKAVVKEFIQKDYNLKNINKELDRLLNDAAYRKAMLVEYDQIKERLGDNKASVIAANVIAGMS